MTLEDLQNSFHALVPEYPFSTSAEIALVVSWFNVGQVDASRKTKCLKKYDITSLKSVAEQMEYDLSVVTGFLDIDKKGGVTYDGMRLDPVTTDELDSTKLNWRAASSSTPKYYYRSGLTIGLYPKPNVASKVIGVHCFYLPTDMSGLTDEPFDKKIHLIPYHDVPLLYSIGLAKFSKGQFATKEQALAEYIARVNAMKAEIKPEEDERPSFKIDPHRASIIKKREGL